MCPSPSQKGPQGRLVMILPFHCPVTYTSFRTHSPLILHVLSLLRPCSLSRHPPVTYLFPQRMVPYLCSLDCDGPFEFPVTYTFSQHLLSLNLRKRPSLHITMSQRLADDLAVSGAEMAPVPQIPVHGEPPAWAEVSLSP